MDLELLKNSVRDEISALQNELRELALDIWEHPEMAWKEEYSSQKLCDFLTAHQIPTEKGYCGENNYSIFLIW